MQLITRRHIHQPWRFEALLLLALAVSVRTEAQSNEPEQNINIEEVFWNRNKIFQIKDPPEVHFNR